MEPILKNKIDVKELLVSMRAIKSATISLIFIENLDL
jgi:hypothetical protein